MRWSELAREDVGRRMAVPPGKLRAGLAVLDMVARKILLQLAVQDIGQLTDFGTIVRGPVLPRTGSQLSPHKQDKGDFSRAMLTPPTASAVGGG